MAWQQFENLMNSLTGNIKLRAKLGFELLDIDNNKQITINEIKHFIYEIAYLWKTLTGSTGIASILNI